MYRQVFIPNEYNNVISIPPMWYGKEIEVTVAPAKKEVKKEKVTKKEQKIDYTDINQVLALVDKKKVAKMKKRLEPYRVDMSDFKFDRDEANNYDD
jgi:NADH:ubiquinone oxidoreductase subunit